MDDCCERQKHKKNSTSSRSLFPKLQYKCFPFFPTTYTTCSSNFREQQLQLFGRVLGHFSHRDGAIITRLHTKCSRGKFRQKVKLMLPQVYHFPEGFLPCSISELTARARCPTGSKWATWGSLLPGQYAPKQPHCQFVPFFVQNRYEKPCYDLMGKTKITQYKHKFYVETVVLFCYFSVLTETKTMETSRLAGFGEFL